MESGTSGIENRLVVIRLIPLTLTHRVFHRPVAGQDRTQGA